ncbi:MAG TPA: NAD(P)H-quinone oxidoreductase [Candidatus Binataceae bacterium]|nr:NAD(P)H-quinone oxidoreductase [Candidatus Binataceae bacterium]
MKAVVAPVAGDASVLRVSQQPAPQPGPQELLIKVAAAGLNRADIGQRMGRYDPPPGTTPILGLECAGEVIAVGAEVSGWRVGERAMALLAGGGYAELATVHHGSAIHVPAALSDVEAAGFPEVYLTAYLELFLLGRVAAGQTVLVHGGGSGVGTAAIQLLREAGAHSIVTAGSADKCERCLRLGADVAINYKDGPFAPKVKAATNGRGVEVVMDIVGAPYLAQNLEVLVTDGRLVLVATQAGAQAEIDLRVVQMKRLSIIGSTLRARTPADKARIVREFLSQFGAALERGALRPPIDSVLPLSEVAQAHRRLEGDHFGKVILAIA